MTIPTYVVMGFLGSGKTTTITTGMKEHKISNIAIFQFEQGLQSSALSHERLHIFSIDTPKKDIVEDCMHIIKSHNYREIWIEWNGMGSIEDFETIFIHSPLRSLLRIQQVYFIASPHWIEKELPYLGTIPMEQFRYANAIHLITDDFHAVHRYHSLSPHATWYAIPNPTVWHDRGTKFHQTLYKKYMIYILLVLILGYGIYVQPQWMTISAAILLQMLPFLILGTALSICVERYLSPYTLQKYLKKPTLVSYMFAMIMALTTPICDCAVIPLLRSLIRRGVSAEISLFFTMVSPLLNPIVLLSTYYAFSQESFILWGRPLLGIILAFIVSRYSASYVTKESYHSAPWKELSIAFDLKKSTSFFSHLKEETLRLLPYMIGGAFISSAFQIFIPSHWMHSISSAPLYIMIPTMIGLAFCVSICSSADAIMARSLMGIIPLPGILSFLLFGPVMDIKNYILLRKFFSSSFVKVYTISICIVTFILCSIYVYIGGLLS